MTIKEQRNAGATYLVSLGVNGVSCPTGLSVERAFQSCRRSTKGHRDCKRKVNGFACKQTLLATSKAQYDARVACTARGRSVGFIYSQNV
jgi:hypothetical protein